MLPWRGFLKRSLWKIVNEIGFARIEFWENL